MDDLIGRFGKFIREDYYDEVLDVLHEYPDKSSLVIDFTRLDKFDSELADKLLDEPDKTLSLIEEAVNKEIIEAQGPLSRDIKVNYRFKNIPDSKEVRIRDLRSKHIGKLIAVEGIVRIRGEVRPEITEVIYECPGCGKEIKIEQEGSSLKKPDECACGRTRNFRLKEKVFSDTQRLLIEEPAEILVGGETPSDIYVKLSEDLAHPKAQSKIIPGNKLRVIGVVRELPRKKGSLKYDIYISVNFVEPRELEWEEVEITEKDIKEIKEVAKNENVYEMLLNSIAPSIYGYRDLKEAITLQLFGAPPKIAADGSRIRGDIHIIAIGDPATGKCVTGDSKILTASGEERKIKEIVQEALSRNKVYEYDGAYCIDNHDILTLNPDAKVTEGKAIVFWKRKAPKNLYKIVTCTGRKITVTPSHPFFVYDGVDIVGKAASEVHEGEFVAVPNQIPIKGKSQRIDMEIKRTPTPNGIHIKVPKKTSTELCRFIGYLLGEGYSRKRATTSIISITNSSPVILKDFEECAKLFKVPVHKQEDWYYITSIELGRFLTKLEPSLLKRAKYKKIPKVIFKCSKKEIAALIRAYFDSDASVDQRERMIEVTSASKELLEGIRSLLLRFGILSQLHSRKARATNSKMKYKKYYRLTISGEDAIKYNEEIGFLHEFKKKRLETVVSKGKIHTNLNLIPNLSETLKFLRERLRMTQFDFMVPRTTYQHYERGDRKPTKEKLRLLIKSFWKRLDEIENLEGEIEKSDWKSLREIREKLNLSQADVGNLAGMSGGNVGYYERREYGGDLKPRKKDIKRATNEVKDALKSFCERLLNNREVLTRLEKLRLLVNSDIFWDQISSIKKIRSKKQWVYDLQVDNTHNFVANNMFVNNTKLLEYVSKLVPRARYVSGKGVSGVGLCVAPDSFVQLSDGSVEKIGDFIEKQFKESKPEKVEEGIFKVKNKGGITIPAISDSLKVKNEKIDYFWKIKSPKKWIRVKTRKGRSLKVTLGTKFLTLNNKGIKWKEATNLKAKDRVALPRVLPHASSIKNFATLRLIENENAHIANAEKIVKKVTDDLAKKYRSLTNLARKKGLKRARIYDWRSGTRNIPLQVFKNFIKESSYALEDIAKSVRKIEVRNGKYIKIPPFINKDLLRFVALVKADGDIYEAEKENRAIIRFHNSSKEMLERFSKLSEKLWGLKPEIINNDWRTPRARINSVIVSEILHKLEVPGGRKSSKIDLPNLILRLPLPWIREYLRCYFDCDGGPAENKSGGSDSIELSTTSKEFAIKLLFVLLRFGLNPKLRVRKREGEKSFYVDKNRNVRKIITKKKKYVVEFRDLKSFKYFSEKIGFGLKEKKDKLNRIISSLSCSNTNVDTVPVGKLIRKLRRKLNLSAEDVWGYKGRNYELGYTDPSKDRLKTIMQKVKSKCSFNGERPDELRLLQNLADSEIFWDEIKEVEEINPESEWTYDLTTKNSHNFIANGLVVHNTATVRHDERFMGGWVLEAGALVLTNKSVLCIDEFGHISKEDQIAMNQALSIQSISVAKASIVATLPSQTAVFAGTNPKFGRFDPYTPISDQIVIPAPLLSRFDLKFIMRDIPSPEQDSKMAEHMLNTHMGKEKTAQPDLEADFIRRYVAYARQNCKPNLTKEAGDKLKEYYISLRKNQAGEDVSAIPLTPRQYEALIRLATASARVRLDEKVRIEDAERAIRLIQTSLRQIGISTETGEMDIDIIETGIPSTQRSRMFRILEAIKELEKSIGKNVPVADVIIKAKDKGIEEADAEQIIQKLKKKGEIFEPKPGFIKKI